MRTSISRLAPSLFTYANREVLNMLKLGECINDASPVPPTLEAKAREMGSETMDVMLEHADEHAAAEMIDIVLGIRAAGLASAGKKPAGQPRRT